MEVFGEPLFLSIEQVLILQKDLIERYGGQHGLRDEGLLSSAVMGPQQTFGGAYVYPTSSADGCRVLGGVGEKPCLFRWQQKDRAKCL